MTMMQWISPTPAQVAEAEALAARIGEQPYWMGDVLCVGQPDPEPGSEPEPETGRGALLAAGFTDAQADAILLALG